jgi:transposase
MPRAIVREIYRLLTNEVEIPEYRDPRPSRQAKNITLTTAANHFEVWPMVISCIERGTRRDDALAINYRKWLSAA